MRLHVVGAPKVLTRNGEADSADAHALHPLLRKRKTDFQIFQPDVRHIADHIVVAVVHAVARQRITGPERLIGDLLTALETLFGPCVGLPLAGQVAVAEHTQGIHALLMPHALPLHAEIQILP